MIAKFLILSSALLTPLFSAESLQEYILHHVTDSDVWNPIPLHFLSLHFPSIRIGSYLEIGNGLHAMMVLLSGIFIVLFFVFAYKKEFNRAPRGMTNFLEVLVIFVRDEICVNYLGEKDGRKFAPLFLNFFFFILFLNVMGLIPVFSTATANINVTGGFAAITLTSMLVLGVVRNGVGGFFKSFIPPGVPAPVLILLFPIELVGFFIKPAALTIRLFANMLSGHLVIFSIIGLVITFGLFGLPALFLALFVYLLEILVAFLQAYIFTMLSAMFLGEVLHPHH